MAGHDGRLLDLGTFLLSRVAIDVPRVFWMKQDSYLQGKKKTFGREKYPRAHRHTGINGICQMSICECVLEYSIDLMKKGREQNQNI